MFLQFTISILSILHCTHLIQYTLMFSVWLALLFLFTIFVIFLYLGLSFSTEYFVCWSFLVTLKFIFFNRYILSSSVYCLNACSILIRRVQLTLAKFIRDAFSLLIGRLKTLFSNLYDASDFLFYTIYIYCK